jgi:hypothetical protein
MVCRCKRGLPHVAGAVSEPGIPGEVPPHLPGHMEAAATRSQEYPTPWKPGRLSTGGGLSEDGEGLHLA